MPRLLTYIRPSKLEVFIALVLLFVNAALQVLGPLLTKLAVDRYLAPTGRPATTILDPFLSDNPWTGLGQISFLYLLAIVGGLLCDFAEQYLMQRVGQKACSIFRGNWRPPVSRRISLISTPNPSALWFLRTPP